MVLRRRARTKIGCPDAEAAVLIHDFGVGAYSEARRREGEASSEAIARDWSRVAVKVAQLAAGLIDGVELPASLGAARQADLKSNDQERLCLAQTRPFRIQFIRLSPGQKGSLVDEVRIEASDTSAAIVAAACTAWPPQTRELRILDPDGRRVFERKANGRRPPPEKFIERLARNLPGRSLADHR